MPPNTILLSEMMRDLNAAHPDLVQQMVEDIDRSGKKGPALLTPTLANELRKRILGKDWSGLDRFPGWTMHEINPAVRVVGHFAGKSAALEGAAAVHPGSPAVTNAARQYLDVGPYALQSTEDVSLAESPDPKAFPPFTTRGIVTAIGENVTRGDGPNPQLAPEHAQSQRTADLLNRLAVNTLDQVAAVSAHLGADTINTPEQLIAALQQSGHTVTVTDSRYFANFGHLHFRGEDVMMPFWVNTRISIPNTGGLFHRPRPLLVPVSHAELEWHIHGPVVNADISYYFGIDGKAEWRTMDTLDQAWVLKRDAHTYSGAQALEATRLATLFTVAYMHLHAAHPALPFGGYYALGVCQDAVSAIEHKLTGQTTLFPNTADDSFFIDPRDAEVNSLMRAIPKDRNGAPPQPARIFGSLPTTDFSRITIPGLSADLNATYSAWKQGKL